MHLSGAIRAAILAPIGYVLLFFCLRLAGKRTLATMNVFDLLVTVALGSTLSEIILINDVSLLQGVVALSVPLLLQFGVAWISSHSEKLERKIKDHPAMLLYKGEILHDMLGHELITEEEVREAVRKAGLSSLKEAKAVVLEVDGQISVIPEREPDYDDESSVLKTVKRRPEGA